MELEKIAENARVLIDEVQRKKPTDIKGEFIKSIAISSTMGPGVMLNPKEKV